MTRAPWWPMLPLVPPLIELGRTLGWQPLPLTIKEGRGFRAWTDHSTGYGRAGVWEWRNLSHLPHPTTPILPHPHTSSSATCTTPTTATRRCAVSAWMCTPGEFVVLMGRNGSGKSTLAQADRGPAEAGRGPGDRGRAGHPAGRPGRRSSRRWATCRSTRARLLFGDTLAAELAFTRRGHGLPPDPAADRALLDRLGLAALADRNPRDLSGGEQQRAALASILAADPNIDPAG